MKVVQPEYKPVKELKPHCPNCKERLRGNNSTALPFQCSCGVWKYHHDIAGLMGHFTIEST